MNQEYLNKRKRYYTNMNVQHELLRTMKDREVIFMDRTDTWKCIRGIWIKSIEYLNKFFDYFNFFERDYNIYISVAKYNYIPPFTLNLSKRSKETQKWFNSDKPNLERYDYNLLFDFDDKYRIKKNNEWEWIIDKIGMIKNIKKVIILAKSTPYYIIPSGNNFQLVAENVSNLNITDIKKWTQKFKDKNKLLFLDMSGIGHAFKIMKCPYSMVGENVCLPMINISDKAFKDYNNFDSNIILKEIKLGFRGIPKHNNGIIINTIKR